MRCCGFCFEGNYEKLDFSVKRIAAASLFYNPNQIHLLLLGLLRA